MKKFQVLLFSAVITAGIGSAFAATRNTSCEYYPQYYYENGNYYYAGRFGYEFLCWDIGGTCTYYRPSMFGPYYPCKTGLFFPL